MLIVVPFNRPERLEHVLKIWRHQYTKAPLVLVANERGAWASRAEETGAVVLVGTPSIGGAKNRGLEHARSVGADWVLFLDDDNYWGPMLVREFVREATDDVEVMSQGIGFVRFDDGLYLFSTPLGFCPGHCTAVRTSLGVYFPELNLGEDVAWTKSLPPNTRVRHLGPWHAIYNRTGIDHAYKVGKVEFLASFGDALEIGDVADDFVDLPRDVSKLNLRRHTANDDEIFASLARHSRFRGGSCSG